MHLVIINASPRVETKSNTARIIRAFVRGFEVNGNTTEVWHLSDKKQWTGAKEAYEKDERRPKVAFFLHVRQRIGHLRIGHIRRKKLKREDHDLGEDFKYPGEHFASAPPCKGLGFLP